MVDIIALKEYFKKLQKIINFPLVYMTLKKRKLIQKSHNRAAEGN